MAGRGGWSSPQTAPSPREKTWLRPLTCRSPPQSTRPRRSRSGAGLIGGRLAAMPAVQITASAGSRSRWGGRAWRSGDPSAAASGVTPPRTSSRPVASMRSTRVPVRRWISRRSRALRAWSRLKERPLGRSSGPCSTSSRIVLPSSRSASLQISSTPLGPAPTTTSRCRGRWRCLSCWSRACSRSTSARLRKSRPCSATPGMPKSSLRPPVASTSRP